MVLCRRSYRRRMREPCKYNSVVTFKLADGTIAERNIT